MASRKTLVIVGAGGSQEARLPTGRELKQKIASILDMRFKSGDRQIDGDHLVYGAIKVAIENRDLKSPDINAYIEAARRIQNAMPQAISIDNFIDSHQGNEEIELCGKLAIVRSILEAEKGSRLYFDSGQSNA